MFPVAGEEVTGQGHEVISDTQQVHQSSWLTGDDCHSPEIWQRIRYLYSFRSKQRRR